MRIFVAGATGALGRQLVPQLVAAGHDVVGMARSSGRADAVAALGARPVVADALDAGAVARAVADAEPEVIVHQLTALSGAMDLKHPEEFFATTNRLRTEGTDNLLAAGRAAGIRRFVAQSNASPGAYARVGGPVKTEDDPLDPDPPAGMRPVFTAIRYLEDAVTGIDWAEGVVLRYGGFYGPGTSLSADPDADMTRALRKRQFPIVGDGGAIWSFLHIEDAAAATVLALDRGGPGIYNIVDDEPAAVREWMPFLAEQLGAKKPFRVPRFVGRLLAGEVAVMMLTELRGSSNAKARRVLGWEPRWSTWRIGFAKGLDE
jgi:nucleoside-diphosphate-sugar epimerase